MRPIWHLRELRQFSDSFINFARLNEYQPRLELKFHIADNGRASEANIRLKIKINSIANIPITDAAFCEYVSAQTGDTENLAHRPPFIRCTVARTSSSMAA